MNNNNSINRHNYELFFLDYAEGALSKEDATLLFDFLQENPDLKEQFNDFIYSEAGILKPDNSIQFKNSECLKQSVAAEINLNNYETFFIAFHEGDLTKNEENSVFCFLAKNPTLHTDFEQIKKSVFRPDYSIVFENKSILKRKNKIKLYRILNFSMSAAAIFVLFFLFKLYFKPITEPKFTQINLDTNLDKQFVVDSNTQEDNVIAKQEIASLTNKTDNKKNVKVKENTVAYERLDFQLKKLQPVNCEYISYNFMPNKLEYRNEAEQLAFEMKLKEMLILSNEVKNQEEKNFVASLFNTAEKIANAFEVY